MCLFTRSRRTGASCSRVVLTRGNIHFFRSGKFTTAANKFSVARGEACAVGGGRGVDDKSLRPDKNRNRSVPRKVKRRRPLKIVNLAESFLGDNAPGVS